ncbi:helix-turn-helix domain-containing protein [Treponema primitia]|uniref:helix-turn-helix domain-containing protein n=1 Tax=Treponema primitia TaxID=88058 RepID=UPI0002555883|nr:helix-turn-helix domain-containing protein [Treponema primitia]
MELLTVSDVASALSVSQSKVYKMAESGELQSVKIGKSLRFTEEQVKKFILQKSAGENK